VNRFTLEDIHQQDLDSARERGRVAFRANRRYTSNPYALGVGEDAALAYAWSQGWLEEEAAQAQQNDKTRP